ncbi:protein-L-isoaspartate O-methyltransferase domain-containing protein 2-like [Spodoptera litura]|uniref:Protein-L-isoaspartate O-methyltransferase domain-containing protein 2-like n=1 Tax=Spodoptera litura TaxID=69820 RepID=A0A9J7DY15_SPOLT|nr:protein-L-isoaspartate O-methyltransferase domain-containing protein 2-like [Spodoptera litura]
MGGAVSSGRDNNELIDNLMGSNYIRTRSVERVFRSLDRADYMTPEARDQAYKDLAWRNGPLHMSAPCIYSEVLEGLELKPGLSFLNIGSGTGYFSTLVGLLIGSSGVNHGIEVHPYVMEYAIKKLGQFIENSPTLDEFDFCEPRFYCGNGLCIAPLQAPYDRLYCGAGCPEEYQNYFKQLIKVGGVLVMPLNDNLVQMKRVTVDHWVSRNLLNVSFATLRIPTKEEALELIRPDEQCPARLQVLARAVVRGGMRAALLARHPHLREPPPRRPQPASSCPRRICIPIEDDSDVAARAERHIRAERAAARAAVAANPDVYNDTILPEYLPEPKPVRSCRGLLTFEFQDERRPVTNAFRQDSPSTSESSKTDSDSAKSDPLKVPAEVEIYLGKEVPSTSRYVQWERQGTEQKQESSSEEDTSQEQKRKKLDSGIGEGTTTSSSSSPAKSESMDESDGDAMQPEIICDELELEYDENLIGGRRRIPKRGHCAQSSTSPEYSASSSTTSGEHSRCKRRAPEREQDEHDDHDEHEEQGEHVSERCDRHGPEHDHDYDHDRSEYDDMRPRRAGADARRVRLSILMKRGVKELPLPYALKKYVNLGRCFEF